MDLFSSFLSAFPYSVHDYLTTFFNKKFSHRANKMEDIYRL